MMEMTVDALAAYRDQIPKLQSTEDLRAASVATVPHMTQDGRKNFLRDLRKAVVPPKRVSWDEVNRRLRQR